MPSYFLVTRHLACAACEMIRLCRTSSEGHCCAGERPLDDSKRLCAHLLEKAIHELDDDCETILGIFDLRGFGTQNADFGFVQFLVSLRRTAVVTH